jgi:hypothetical protein
VPDPDPRVEDFRAKMEAFQDEAWSLATYMEKPPDYEVYSKKYDTVAELFARIPDPVPGKPALKEARQVGEQVRMLFAVYKSSLRLTTGGVGRTVPVRVYAECKAAAAEQKRLLARIDTLLDGGPDSPPPNDTPASPAK